MTSVTGDFTDLISPHEEHPGEELWCERSADSPGGWHLVWRKNDEATG